MNTFRQHTPNFVDLDEPAPTCEFETTEQLLNLEVVQRYGNGDNFSHFALNGNQLMVVSDEGFTWWVVGYIDNPDDVNLPKWSGGRYRAEMPDGNEVVLTHEVVSSCGEKLTLQDGTVAKDLSR